MKNYKTVLFIIFIFLYAAGILTGSIREARVENQVNMYEYLENAVSGYDILPKDNIKSIFFDNIIILGILALGGIIPLGAIILAVSVFIKGYTAGFAITAMLRLYGMKGLIFCGANFISAALVIPVILWYCTRATESLVMDRRDKGVFFRKYFILLSIMFFVFCIDSILRGYLSPILMKSASGG